MSLEFIIFTTDKKKSEEKKQQQSASQAWHAAVVSSVIKMKVNVKQKKHNQKSVDAKKNLLTKKGERNALRGRDLYIHTTTVCCMSVCLQLFSSLSLAKHVLWFCVERKKSTQRNNNKNPLFLHLSHFARRE